MSAVFAQEMHRPLRGPNMELILPPPLGRASILLKVGWGGEDHAPCSEYQPWTNTAVLALGRLPQEGGFGEAERKEITELNTSLEQGFGFWCHNTSPLPYFRISTNTAVRANSTQEETGT